MKRRRKNSKPHNGINHRRAFDHARQVLNPPKLKRHSRSYSPNSFSVELQHSEGGDPLKLLFRITQGLRIYTLGEGVTSRAESWKSRETQTPLIKKPTRLAKYRTEQYRQAIIDRQQLPGAALSFRHFNLLIAALSPTLT